ncbi:hypothetical protein COE51_06165 [Bacillus pseudomycoides]|nr:hypothetical protein COE51_06165 [Bacillus pseudomycoides]
MLLQEFFTRRARLIKSLLLDQSKISGMGNIYADEILYNSKIYPKRLSATLNDAEWEALHQSIVSIIEGYIACRGTYNYME